MQESKHFILSSTCFDELNQEIESTINNFKIILQDGITIECNHTLRSLISNKIMKIIRKSNFIDFSSFEYPKMVIELFSVLKGKVSLFEGFNHKLLIETSLFVEVEVEMLKNIIQISLQDISLFLSIKFREILSSPFIYLNNETELFQLILDQIQEDRNNISLIKHIYFGLIDYNSFVHSVSLIEFSEISN
jgi:hypothetical protein